MLTKDRFRNLQCVVSQNSYDHYDVDGNVMIVSCVITHPYDNLRCCFCKTIPPP